MYQQPQQQPYQPREQMVKVYKAGWPSYSAVKKFQHDSRKLQRQGWRVQSQSSLEKVSLGRKGITVVYVR
jgi:hypothetical protein